MDVSLSTVEKWRRHPDYRALRDQYDREAHAAILDDVLTVRRASLDLLLRSVSAAGKLLDPVVEVDEDGEEEVTPPTADAVAKAAAIARDAFRLTSAQTGIGESSKLEVQVTPPEEARKLLRAELKTLTTEELRALQAREP